MNNNKRLKGFTLVEMIIVVAIFGVIMAVVLSLLDPVRKVYNNTYNEADTQAISENMRRYIGDQVQYADRMWVYTNLTLDDVHEEVQNFRENYYFEAGSVPHKGSTITSERLYPYSKFKGNDEVYVLHINNLATDFSSVTSMSSATHPGTITLSSYKGGKTPAEFEREWSSNTDYYDDYAFDITLQTAVKNATSGEYEYLDLLDVLEGAVDPTNLAMGINMYRRSRDRANPGNVLISDTFTHRTITFKLKNLINSNNTLTDEEISFPDYSGEKVSPVNKRRFVWYDSDSTRPNSNTPLSGYSSSRDIYFIFTKVPYVEKVIK